MTLTIFPNDKYMANGKDFRFSSDTAINMIKLNISHL